MSHRRPEPHQTALENVLRNALRLAADSVDPAADGLDRIHAKISARQPVPLPSWRTAVPVLLWSLLRWLEPAVIWLRYALGVVVDRFRPDPGRAARAGWLGWLGWLRPAAAMATGVFVVAAATWAIAALPAAITTTDNSTRIHQSEPGGHSGSAAPPSKSGTLSGSGETGTTSAGSPSPSRSCKSTPPAVSPSSSASPSGSPSRSPTTSSSPSSSPSPSPSPSSTSVTPSPSDSPTSPPLTNSPAAQVARTGSGWASGTAGGSPPGSSPGSSSAGSVTSSTPLTNQPSHTSC